MSAVALIQFFQGTPLGVGRSVVAAMGVPIVVTNSDNTDVRSWRIELLFAPLGSAYACAVPVYPTYDGTVLAENANGTSPNFAFPALSAAYPGSYRIRLSVWSAAGFSGTKDVDIRNIAVVTPNKNLVIPPPQIDPPPLPRNGTGSKPSELNFNAQVYGWAGDADPAHRLLNELILYVDSLMSESEAADIFLSQVDAANTYLTQVDAANTYLTPAGAADTYLSKVDAALTYLAIEDYQPPGQIHLSISAGETIINTSVGWRLVGTLSFNSADYAYTQATIEYLVYVGDISNIAEVRFMNTTTGLQVGTTKSTSSLIATKLTENINMTAGANIYEVQLKSNTDAIIAACSGAKLVLS